MVYLDTNVLIYASVVQSEEKKEKSLQLIKRLIEQKRLVLSTLVLQEFVFTLAKLGVESEIIKKDSDFYFDFVAVEYDYATLRLAINSCCENGNCKNINDIIHLHLAEKNRCKKLLTFDKDFLKIVSHSNIKVEVLS